MVAYLKCIGPCACPAPISRKGPPPQWGTAVGTAPCSCPAGVFVTVFQLALDKFHVGTAPCACPPRIPRKGTPHCPIRLAKFMRDKGRTWGKAESSCLSCSPHDASVRLHL